MDRKCSEILSNFHLVPVKYIQNITKFSFNNLTGFCQALCPFCIYVWKFKNGHRLTLSQLSVIMYVLHFLFLSCQAVLPSVFPTFGLSVLLHVCMFVCLIVKKNFYIKMKIWIFQKQKEIFFQKKKSVQFKNKRCLKRLFPFQRHKSRLKKWNENLHTIQIQIQTLCSKPMASKLVIPKHKPGSWYGYICGSGIIRAYGKDESSWLQQRLLAACPPKCLGNLWCQAP